jgi:hypothetical protein
VRFTLAPGKILQIALENRGSEKRLIDRICQAQPNQPDFARLRSRLDTATTPQQIAAAIARFIQSGGE